MLTEISGVLILEIPKSWYKFALVSVGESKGGVWVLERWSHWGRAAGWPEMRGVSTGVLGVLMGEIKFFMFYFGLELHLEI